MNWVMRASGRLIYKLKDGTVVDVNKEEDVHFEECEELRDIEREYDFLFDAVTDLHGDNLLIKLDYIR
ncbi:hypothetical protein [Butyrivibrio sp.]|uniref:hypothetical protein n=1 Tax=Butyrivibrio sp. TaxID=28121 RepID=UPI0025B7AB9C|nr:hypothetical protein [Butyrivibrio sp.]